MSGESPYYFDTDRPWIVWRFLTTDRRTRITGRSKVAMTCAVCGHREVITVRIPRSGSIATPEAGKHSARLAFMETHAHPDRGSPMSWAMPLLNPAAHQGGLDLDALAMRMEADLRGDQGPTE